MVETSPLQSVLSALWQQLGSNPANRALVIARVLVHHADPTLSKLYSDLIERSTPDCSERKDALALLRPPTYFSHIQIVAPSPSLPSGLRVEPEMGRLTICLECAAEYRVWIVGRDITRSTTGSGKIEKSALRDELAVLDIPYTRRHFNRLLVQGEGVFWYVHRETIYLRSALNVAQAISALAENRDFETDTNRPGVRDVYLDVSGSLERWEAMLYAGWIAYRGYSKDITIARATLSSLFGRHEQTIRRWEAKRLQGLLTKQTNFAQCPDTERYFPYLPDHAQPYVARIVYKNTMTDLVRLFWQLPNTYHSLIETHPHKGQARKVRKAVSVGEPPASARRGGNYRLYFTPEQLKRRSRNRRFWMNYIGDVNKPVYVFLGQHRHTQRRIFEVNNSGFIFTSASERTAPEVESAFFKRQEEKFVRLQQNRRN